MKEDKMRKTSNHLKIRFLIKIGSNSPAGERNRTLVHAIAVSIILLSSTIRTFDAVSKVPRVGFEYCDTEIFRASCSESEVIIVDSALYGRMRLGRCVENDMGHIGCSRDVLLTADRRCSGRRSCEIRVPDAELENTKPCLKELKTYLEISYRCVTVHRLTEEICLANDHFRIHSSFPVFIASIMTSDIPNCDGNTKPWIISAHLGQVINLTLFDFSMQQLQQQPHPGSALAVIQDRFRLSDSSRKCRRYGSIEDNGVPGKLFPVCGGNTSRVSALYLSTGNVVKIWVTAGTGPRDLQRFLIQHSVVGCADLEMPSNAWFQRTVDGNGLIGCKGHEGTWRILCHQQNWIGSVRNCSSENYKDSDYDVESFKTTLNIVVPAAVVSGVTVIAVAICVTFASCRQQRGNNGKPPGPVGLSTGEDRTSRGGHLSNQAGFDPVFTVATLATPSSNCASIRQVAPHVDKFRYVELGSFC